MEPTQENSGITNRAELSDIERLKEELRHEHEMYLRTLADFDNYRRRVEREQTSVARRGKREVLLSLLEVLDAFDRAFRQVRNEPASVSDGLQAIYRKLLNVLETQGVTPFQSCTKPLARYRATSMRPTQSWTRCSVATAGATRYSGLHACELRSKQ
jgi:molecular chaperone GrpE